MRPLDSQEPWRRWGYVQHADGAHRPARHRAPEEKLSQTTKGIRSVLLKVIDPFFKKKHRRESIVPMKITGTFRSASAGVGLGQVNSSKRKFSPSAREFRQIFRKAAHIV